MALLFVLVYFLFLQDSSDGGVAIESTTTTAPGVTTTVPGATTTPAVTTVPAATPTTVGAAPAPQPTAAPAPQPTAAPAPPATTDPCLTPTPPQNFPLSVTIPFQPDFLAEQFALVPGDVLRLDINDVFGLGIDSFLRVLDPNGNPVGSNDDKQPGDLMSALSVTAQLCGLYTAEIDAFQGSADGDAQMTVSVN
jgi:hypothetical protein